MKGNCWRNAADSNRGVALLQAARGPVVLITIGGLFLLNQVGLSFGRTWPLILIVIGVMKLLERLAAHQFPGAPYTQQGPYAPPPPGATPPYGAYGPPPPPPPDPFANPAGQGRHRQ